MPFLTLAVRGNPLFQPHLASAEFQNQWAEPSDVFSVLLILGGDVVNRALAQLAGGRFTPVTFSFGWVGYSIVALVSALGDNKLMPTPDCKSIVLNGRNGYFRDNSSWVLSRIIRDYEHWMHRDVAARTTGVINEKWKILKENEPGAEKPYPVGLVVSFYRPKAPWEIGKRKLGLRTRDTESFKPLIVKDIIYWSGAVVTIIQLAIAAIPCGIYGDYSIILVTAIGIGLAFSTGALSQWRKEKWACRRSSNKNVILTRGNGDQHAIVILGNGFGMNLEDLATGSTNVRTHTSRWTKVMLMALAIAWVMLLITAAGIKTNTWFLLAVGGVGIFQNILVAGWPRHPENFGIHLEFVDVIGRTKAMDTLYACEDKYPCIGQSLLTTFYPAGLRLGEEAKWEEYKKSKDERFRKWKVEWSKNGSESA